MTEQKFWEIIDESIKKSEGDKDKQLEFLITKLVEMSVEEIFDFDGILNRYYMESYTSELWAAAYIINGGCSDDGFDYFRGWLISRGQKVYEEAVRNPESLAKVVKEDEIGEVEFEEFLCVACDAYRKKTQKDDFYDKVERSSYPQLELEWSEDEEELEEMFPKLTKKFW